MNFLSNVHNWVWFIIGGFVILIYELGMILRYRNLTNRARIRPAIRFHFKGSITENSVKEASESLHFQINSIINTFTRTRAESGFQDAPVGVGKEFCTMMALANASLNLDPSEHPRIS